MNVHNTIYWLEQLKALEQIFHPEKLKAIE